MRREAAAGVPEPKGIPIGPGEAPPLPPVGLEGEPAAPAPRPPRKPVEVATLTFLDPDAISTNVPLRYPFAWDGAEIRSVTVRRLSAAEVGMISGDLGEGDTIELYAFYAAMTGLPAEVLRGMIDDDNIAVTEVALPFLPGLAKGLFFPTFAPGDASASSPAAP